MKRLVMLFLGVFACAATLSASAWAQYEGSCEELRHACQYKNQLGDAVSSGDYYCRKYRQQCAPAPQLSNCERLRRSCIIARERGYGEERCHTYREVCGSDEGYGRRGYEGSRRDSYDQAACARLNRACREENDRGEYHGSNCRTLHEQCR